LSPGHAGLWRGLADSPGAVVIRHAGGDVLTLLRSVSEGRIIAPPAASGFPMAHYPRKAMQYACFPGLSLNVVNEGSPLA